MQDAVISDGGRLFDLNSRAHWSCCFPDNIERKKLNLLFVLSVSWRVDQHKPILCAESPILVLCKTPIQNFHQSLRDYR